MEYRGPAPHPLLQHPPSHATPMFFYPGLPPGSKPPNTSHLVPSVTAQSKHHRSGAPLPGGHTVPGPGPGMPPQTQPPSGGGGDRSFAAALRKLAKQAVPPSERECEGETPPARQVSPKARGPPPLVRGASPTAGGAQDSRKDRGLSHEQHNPRSSSRQEEAQLYGTRATNSTGSVAEAPASQLLARSGFQPYRPEEARLGHPPPAPGPPPPPFALDPAAAAAYSQYHHGLYPTHLQHPYSLEGQLCLERCGMLRPPLFPPLPSYHLYGLPRYSPEMLPTPFGLISPGMHERLKLEEEHRQRETQRFREEEKEREREREQEREREKERREKARRSPRASPSHHQEVPARKAPITGVRDRTADSIRKDVDPSHSSTRPPHPPPLIAPGSIPTPTVVTLPPPLHPIPNPPLESELHQHSGKSLLTQQSSSHISGIPRLPYSTGVPPLPSHHPHSSTPPSHNLPSHHPHPPTPPTMPSQHRLTTTPPHPTSSHIQHASTPPTHSHSTTPQHSSASHYVSSQHSLPHQRTNSLTSTTRNNKEPAFVRPFEDNFPQQHISNRRSPVVSCGTLLSPAKERIAPDIIHVSSINECVTNSGGIVSSKSHHHHVTNSILHSNSVSSTVNSNRTTSAREEMITQPRTYSSSKDTSSLVQATSDCVIQKVVTSSRGPHSAAAGPLESLTSSSFPSLNTVNQIPLQPFQCHGVQSAGLSPHIVHLNQTYHPPQDQPGTMQLVTQPMQISAPISQTTQPTYCTVRTSPIQHVGNKDQSSTQPSNQSTVQLQSPSSREQSQPAVLNVPDAAKVLAAVSAKDGTGAMSVWDYHFLSKSISSQRAAESDTVPAGLLSRLDLAERRRKERRNAANVASPTSDSDSEENDALMSVWLTKGPPSQLDSSPKKLKFLGIFGLITLSKRNELELCKLERRTARSPSLPRMEDVAYADGNRIPSPLSLPTPQDSPESLNRLVDYKSKVRFFRSMGLDVLSRKDREESEVIWQSVVAERLRRKCINSVVAYCNRSLTKVPEGSCHTDRLIKIIPDMMGRARSNKRPHSPTAMLPTPGQNGTRPGFHFANIPAPSALLLQNGVKRLAADREGDGESPAWDEDRPRPRWPGLEQVMEAYLRYSQERGLEHTVLQEQCARQCRMLAERRREADMLDRRLRELVARKSLHDYERHQTQQALDHLNACLRKLR